VSTGHSTPPSVTIGGRRIARGEMPFVLAEMACAHDGNLDRAIQMINDAADGGADGIQFQIFSTDRLLTPRHKFYTTVKSLEISYSDWGRLFDRARERKLIVFVNPLTVDALDVVKKCGADAIKIHSADLSNPGMGKAVVSFGLPISVSAGGSTEDEIQTSLASLRSDGVKNLLLMHGFQAYPTRIEHSNLNYIATLEETFGVPVGYQDHIDGEDEMALIVPALAAALGASLLEKHITDSRARKGTDYQSALDRDGFARFVRISRNAHKALGATRRTDLSEAELEYRKTFKKSLVAARDIKPGESISQDMIQFMRGDALGLTPKELPKVLERKARTAIKKFDVITQEHLS
jgi:sialic acid synthase SpsE